MQITTGIRSVLSHPLVYGAFQNLLGAKRGRVRFVRDQVRPQLGMRILDLGCGPAEILGSLPQDVVYVGYDMSAEYIAHAQRKFGQRGDFRCRLLEQAEVATLEPFDLVMGIGVLHHLDDATARAFMTIAGAALKPGGRILTVDPCLAARQNPIARFLITRDRGQHVRDADGYLVLVGDTGFEVTGRIAHQAWIPYTHWYMECRVPV